jgi:hypothetical protein
MERLLTLIILGDFLRAFSVAARTAAAHRPQMAVAIKLKRGFRADAAAPKKNSLPHF